MSIKLHDHFSRKEFTCHCGCGFDTVDAELLYVLIGLRGQFNAAININSGARCIKHNKFVGGKKSSQHLLGRAADIDVYQIHPDIVADHLESIYPGKYGIGRYNGFTHIDTRAYQARWDERRKS